MVDIGWPYDWYSYPYPFWYDHCIYYDGDVYQPGARAAIGGGESVVADVQQQLMNKGYNPGPADGRMGPQTRDAIEAYQQDYGLTPSGRINGPLLDSLGL